MTFNKKTSDTTKQLDEKQTSLQEEPLLKARQILYECINTPSPSSQSPFFTEGEKNHKRGLVGIMIQIDKKLIATEHQLWKAMNHMAGTHQSAAFNKALDAIKELIQQPSNLEDDITPGPVNKI